MSPPTLSPAALNRALLARQLLLARARDGRVTVEMLEDVGRRDRDAVEAERTALEAFHR